jgi:hypothetical protein
MNRLTTVILCVTALCLYGVSLFLPAFTCAHTNSFPGYGVLAIGYMGLLGLDPRWFGNVGFFWLIVTTLKSPSSNHPIVLGSTVVLALASFAAAAGCEGGGGAPAMSTGLALGGYLWVAALLIACVASFSFRQETKEPEYYVATVPKQEE